jgi:hypothetical protein
MAKADSVPSVNRAPITGARPDSLTESRFAGPLYPDATSVILSIDDLINRLVLGHDQAILIKALAGRR